MARILLANEFGSGLGHVNRLVAVARRLSPDDDLIFALPNIDAMVPIITRAFGQRAGLQSCIEWPAPTDPSARMIPTHTLADVLRLFSFDNKIILSRAVTIWRTLINNIMPDLIIADFAPTLRLAIGNTIPTIIVGNGYTVPPSGRLLPPIRPWQLDVPAASLFGEERMLSVINDIRSENGIPAINFVADLFSGLQTFIGTLPEFDPYRSYRTQPVRSPFNVPSVLPGPAAADRLGPSIFTYLPASHPLLDTVIETLNTIKYRTYLYISDINPRNIARRCTNHIGILTKPADFADILPNVQLLIHHAGLGTAYAGLAAGTPQLVLPLNLEHLITSRGLIEVGVALGFNKPPPDVAALSDAVKTLLTEPVWMARAATRAAALAQSKDPDPLAAVISAYRQITNALMRS